MDYHTKTSYLSTVCLAAVTDPNYRSSLLIIQRSAATPPAARVIYCGFAMVTGDTGRYWNGFWFLFFLLWVTIDDRTGWMDGWMDG